MMSYDSISLALIERGKPTLRIRFRLAVRIRYGSY